MNDLEFFSATIGDTIFYKGQLCKFVEDGNHQIGRIETFIENVHAGMAKIGLLINNTKKYQVIELFYINHNI